MADANMTELGTDHQKSDGLMGVTGEVLSFMNFRPFVCARIFCGTLKVFFFSFRFVQQKMWI
jgi:hypothetical protein